MEHFYHTLQGEHWFDYELVYASMVRHFRDGAHFVEVGSYIGRSSVYMAVEILNSGKNIKFDCVDHFKGYGDNYERTNNEPAPWDLNPEYIWEEFNKNIEPVKDIITVHRMSSLEASKLYKDKSLDFVFLDAGHSAKELIEDIEAWKPKLKSGAIIAGHDYGALEYPDVKYVIDRVFPERAIIEGRLTGCWAVLLEGFTRSNKSTRII